MKLQVGEKITFERTFTKEDVALFTEVSKDEGAHHVTPDEQGRFVVQGLLTSTLPTKIGGDYNVLARKTDFEFLRPVFSGDTIRCDVTSEQFESDEKNRTKIITMLTYRNQLEEEGMKGR
ncbi:MaoC/PaaZ C-terminal domain-containing protein [Bacillus sp. SRB1LM]|uniref:MaoC/PaaZ C-terminal domain-containing protein n=1 Tax=Bacillus sp. SRB1LM TaxID=2608688 RepID=UPI0018C3B1B7|nr:MaoC/PaaZ C-terminal domain-containing protein [Bacillus sp. SRB1LM]MBG0964980.1 enoyl-CoA hydratase [Bacillus sp. SRB1LM]